MFCVSSFREDGKPSGCSIRVVVLYFACVLFYGGREFGNAFLICLTDFKDS